MQKRKRESRPRKKSARELKSDALKRRMKSEDRIFAEDSRTEPDLSKRIGSSELSGEAAAMLFERYQDRVRGRARFRIEGEKAAFPSGTKAAALRMTRSRSH